MNLPQILSFMDDNEIEGKISVHVCCFIFGGDASGSTFLITARRILSLELLRISYMIMSPIMNLIPGEGPLDKIFYHLEFAWVLFPRFFSPTLCYLYCPSCRFCRTVVSSLCGSEDIEGAILFGFIGVTNVFGVIGFSPLALCFPSDIQSCHMA
ncbi:MAG: hypothetical protein DRN37_03295 [Thermoplasmata archaeon]|nr:MAG: hypothetical protein DRN37_03295 [Thermoplasmata archaeon]